MLDLMFWMLGWLEILRQGEYVHYLILEMPFVTKEVLYIVALKLDISICIVSVLKETHKETKKQTIGCDSRH